MTLIGIGPFWLYQSIFFYFSLSPKVNQADETLRRIYNRNCKTLSINSAGKHHRGFSPSRCSRNCSLLSSNTLDTHILIYQSINLCEIFFLHFKLLQLLNSGRPIFVGSQTRRTMLSAVLGSMLVLLSTFPPFMLQNVGSFCFNFDLAIFAVVVSLAFVLAKSIHWLEHTLYLAIFTLTFSYICCWPHQTCWAFIQNWILLLLLGASRVLQKSAANRPRLALSTTDNSNLRMAMSVCNFNFWLGVVWKWFYVCELVLHRKHSLASAELAAVGRGCSTPAVRAPL